MLETDLTAISQEIPKDCCEVSCLGEIGMMQLAGMGREKRGQVSVVWTWTIHVQF